jgi:uncharacterized protein
MLDACARKQRWLCRLQGNCCRALLRARQLASTAGEIQGFIVPNALITPQFISVVREHFALDWSGIHGAAHWARVRQNGLRLAEETGARTDVVELFAFLHDVERKSDGWDLQHGKRAAQFVRSRHGSLFTLDEEGLELLCDACAGHSDGLLEAHVTIQTCWDADRLDLGRIGIVPDPARLCTAAARDRKTIERAYARSRK